LRAARITDDRYAGQLGRVHPLRPGDEGRVLNCTVYRVANGRLVLVPDCMQAFMTVEAELGALVRCGSIETDLLEKLLAHQIECEIDDRFYAICPPDLALRFGYRPDTMIELPSEFRWEGGDWWTEGDAVRLLCCGQVTTPVASIVPGPQHAWKATINEHKDVLFRGEMITTSRASAMQFVALWARAHRNALCRETARQAHAVMPRDRAHP
jgi:hypothetical protein